MTDEPTLDALRERAAELKIEGRSRMARPELVTAIAAAEAAQDVNAQAAAQATPQAQENTAAIAAAAVAGELEPTPDELVGRPPLLDLAEQRAARRATNMRVIGSPNQED